MLSVDSTLVAENEMEIQRVAAITKNFKSTTDTFVRAIQYSIQSFLLSNLSPPPTHPSPHPHPLSFSPDDLLC
jgi:hypothetical protein